MPNMTKFMLFVSMQRAAGRQSVVWTFSSITRQSILPFVRPSVFLAGWLAGADCTALLIQPWFPVALTDGVSASVRSRWRRST
jgi:hypothetical protein